MTHKFEEYPELSEMMQEYAAFGSFSDWQKFTDALNNALIKAENLPIHNVVRQSEQLVCSCGSIKVQTTGGSQCPNNRCSSAN
jgi:hypothetical protein